MNYAYARVSAKDQNLQRQIAAFSEFGIEKSRIFSEKKSGKDFERKEYKRLLKKLNCGDLLVIKSIDRLGRNYSQIIEQGELLLNLIFPDYPDGHGDDGENAQKMPAAEQSQIANATQLNEKETDKAVSSSDINAECAYTSRLVE